MASTGRISTFFAFIAAACVGMAASACSSERGGSPDAAAEEEPDADSAESPCPCEGDAECVDDGIEEFCEVPLGGDCGVDDYRCASDLDCEGSICVGEEGAQCDEHDECGSGLDCVRGSCAETICDGDFVCPEDGDSETVEQPYCHEDGDACVECRYWEDGGHDDCSGGEVCVDEFGYCADAYTVPRDEPIEESLAEEEALAIAAVQCYLDTEELTTNAPGSTRNAFCGVVEMEDAEKDLNIDDIRPRATDGEFDYLADEGGTIDGYDTDELADHMDYIWEDSSTRRRLSWFDEDPEREIDRDSRYEICVWMGKRGSGPWRIGIDTCEAYLERGYVDDWDEDGQD